MNEREREQERERERRRTCKSIVTLSPSSPRSTRGDPPTARLFVFFSRGRRKRFYARGEKFENFSHKSLRCGFARAHVYIHTRERKREKRRERENTRESERLLKREKRFLLNAIYYYSLYHTPPPREPKTLNTQCPIFSFFFSSLETRRGRRTCSLSGYLHTHTHHLILSLSCCN